MGVRDNKHGIYELEDNNVKPKTIEVAEEAQKIEESRKAGENYTYLHPLMNSQMNLLEISHRQVERLEKIKYKIVAASDGSFEEDVEKFKDELFYELVKMP